MKDAERQQWQDEFESFATGAETPPPPLVSEAVSARVYRELNPSQLKVFGKLCAVTFLGGILSLAFCPQFGLGFTRHSHTLMHFFAALGEAGCAAACGGIFLGISALLAAMILRIEELRLIRRFRFLQIPVAALAALSFFVCAGAEVLLFSALTWWLGAVGVGVLSLEVGWTARLYLRSGAETG